MTQLVNRVERTLSRCRDEASASLAATIRGRFPFPRPFVLIAAVSLLTGHPVAGQVRTPPRDVALPGAPPTSGNASIVGRVTAAETGAPVRQVVVSASAVRGAAQAALTDDDGRFELRDLPAGAWQLTFSRAGYIEYKSGQKRPLGRASPVALGTGQRINVDVALTRASAIIGRVYDEFGEPVTAARVMVLRPRMVNQKRYLEPIGDGDLTDDLGAFRLHSLPPGEYYVSASARYAPPDSVVQTTFAPTFYPGTADFASAQKIRLAPGMDAIIDFPLLPIRSARVSGMVFSSDGAPADAFLNLTNEATEFGTGMGGGGVTREDGTFVIADIAPGTYTLVAELRSGQTSTEVGAVSVVVDGTDVGGLTVVTTRPGSLRGTVVADNGVKRRLPEVLEISTHPHRAGAQGTFVTAKGNVFEVAAPPGPFTVTAEPPAGWAVKSALIGGFDATDLAIDIAGEQNVPVTIVLTDRLTEVTGTIRGADLAGAYVVVFPADSSNWTSRFIRRTETDARGRFRIAGLPPGQGYFAVAVRDLEEGEEYDPVFLQQVQKDAIAFDLAPEEKRTLDLTMGGR